MKSKSITLTLGALIFSMFFGAGNVVFPLLIGKVSLEKIPFAMVGLLLTAVGGPLLGLFSATLFHGDSKGFFARAGKIPGLILLGISLALLGPFAVLPRCVIVAYAALSDMLYGMSLTWFSILFGAFVFLASLEKKKVVALLGKILSPILLICLFIIIIRGLMLGGTLPTTSMSSAKAFQTGLFVGYDTMDLIASIFFSSAIWNLVMLELTSKKEPSDSKNILRITLFSGIIGGSFLALVYLGLGYIAALHANTLAGVAPEKYLKTLAYLTMGTSYGKIAGVAVALACLTTVIGLTVTLVELFKKELFPKVFTKNQTLFGCCLLTTIFANLGFSNIMAVIHPVVAICYPAIIALTICNLMHKLVGFHRVKTPVYSIFLVAFLYNCFLA